MTTALADVNVLLALVDPAHVHHGIAGRWFSRVQTAGWATCPITENGFIRVASHPKYPNRPGGVEVVRSVLEQLCGLAGHEFWPDDISIRDCLVPMTVMPASSVTDVYLLALAVSRDGRLATLDRGIPAGCVQHGADHLEVLSESAGPLD